MRATLHTDGGSRGNPGPAGIGVQLADEGGEVIGEIARGIGETTNNVAEYTALVTGLELALEKGVRDLVIRLDSTVVANQISGKMKVSSPRLRDLVEEARLLMGRFDSAVIERVPREQNKAADRLANQGMNSAALGAVQEPAIPARKPNSGGPAATLHADGGARGNPGPAGIGVVLTDEAGEVIGEIGRGIGETTNNVAEYSALIAGLELALERGVTDIDIAMDSELVVNQVQGSWKIKNDRLRSLAVTAQGLMNRFATASIRRVPREKNAGADRLANQGMDQAALDADQDAESPQQASFLD
ncbi:MAG: ribonuclease HI family protein [Actinomycetota bacterium]|nr:ribonuclease HI family protein [Actinomycetota bacterium]